MNIRNTIIDVALALILAQATAKQKLVSSILYLISFYHQFAKTRINILCGFLSIPWASQPSSQLGFAPSGPQPTTKPTKFPTVKPTKLPTRVPTIQATTKPTRFPTIKRESKPTRSPTIQPTNPSLLQSLFLFLFFAGHSMDNGTALLTPGSSQQKALALVQISTTLNNSARDYILLQYYALAVIYRSAESFIQSKLEKWLTIGYDFCNWLSVGCKKKGQLSPKFCLILFLFFEGSIPPEIGLLTSLTYLDFWASKLTCHRLLVPSS